ncbi:fimbrillin family protein [Sphingobacterium rhinopitheci]|uniref:fimbrillin family protein n=1 Tax=Sphingobacterium rhinopitheci TaxID=2781960 RepID=UPI001F5197E9|nr:fimbrillin family protein [Sphingobacterium rhinopitheci]MCI0921728.1 hypothetical protein [Sphingobacterium rhinopitheci]
MNSYFTSYRFLFVIVTFIAVIAFVSCEKALHDESISSEKATVSFKVAGVNSEASISKLGTSDRAVYTTKIVGQSKANTISKNVSLEVDQSVENMSSSFDNMSIALAKGGSASKTPNKKAALSYLPSDAKFRIVLINPSGVIVYNEQTTSDEVITFDLIIGEQYSWYAYSYADDEDIPVATGEVVRTPIDRDFLYAKSATPLIAQAKNNPVSIVFNHQVALISIELDYDKLYAEIPTDASNPSSISTNFDWSLDHPEGFLYSADFSLRTGQVSNEVSDDLVDLNELLKDHPTARNVKVVELYTVASPSTVTPSTSFSVTLNLLKARYPNMAVGSTVNLIGGSSTVSNTFTDLTRTAGKKYVAKFKLKYTFPSFKILHVAGNEGVGFVVDDVHHASYDMLHKAINFSTTTANSVVRSEGFTHETISTTTGLEAALHLTSGTPPDIVILGGGYNLSSNDISSLVTYLDRGGVLFLMSGGVSTNLNYSAGHQEFFQSLFNTPSIIASPSDYGGGSVYKLTPYDDGILNGPFGDVQSQYWGKHNLVNKTIVLKNFPVADVVQYSGSNPVNSNETVSDGATMLKHKNRHFFWVGDGGFVYVLSLYNTMTFNHTAPFALFNLPLEKRSLPMARPYGIAGGEFAERAFSVYNSTIYGNFIAWAVANAEFFGINNGGLGSGPYHEF